MTSPDPVLRQLAAGVNVTPPTDEAELLRSAVEHRMVAQVLAAHLDGRLPVSVDSVTTLGIWDLEERRLHLQFWKTISEVRERLAPLDADVAVLKGVATEARWYDELGERSCTDVDLLLSPDALERVGDVVAALDPTHRALPAVQALVQRRSLQHVDLEVGSTPVDLHFDPFKIGVSTRHLDAVWDATQHLDTPHGTVRVLPAEMELVLLLLHLNKDGFAYLGPFLDIARLLERADLDWDHLRSFVVGQGFEVTVWRSLAAVADALGLRVDPPTVSGPRARAWDRLWGPRSQLHGHHGRARARRRQRWLPLHVRGRTDDVVRELRRQVLPRRELLEIAGRIEPGDSYGRAVASAALRRVRRMSDR